jgi:hypothetical protein
MLPRAQTALKTTKHVVKNKYYNCSTDFRAEIKTLALFLAAVQLPALAHLQRQNTEAE